MWNNPSILMFSKERYFMNWKIWKENLWLISILQRYQGFENVTSSRTDFYLHNPLEITWINKRNPLILSIESHAKGSLDKVIYKRRFPNVSPWLLLALIAVEWCDELNAAVNPFFATWLEANKVSKRVGKTWESVARCESVLQVSRRWFELGEKGERWGKPEVGEKKGGERVDRPLMEADERVFSGKNTSSSISRARGILCVFKSS